MDNVAAAELEFSYATELEELLVEDLSANILQHIPVLIEMSDPDEY